MILSIMEELSMLINLLRKWAKDKIKWKIELVGSIKKSSIKV